MILFTDANLKDFAYGFIERLYSDYCENGQAEREKKIAKIIQDIKNTPDWYQAIQEQAREEQITIEEALRKNATYILEQETTL
jgi:hypothetical protein